MDFVKKMLVKRALKEKAQRYNEMAHKLMCSNVEVACAEYVMGAAHMDTVSFVTQGMRDVDLKKYTDLLHHVRLG